MSAERPAADVVVKVGGGLLAHPAALDRVLALLEDAARARRVLVVPGGGPFADAVRAADARLALRPSAAHWMAILAMDQCAHLLASRAHAARLVATRAEIAAALDGRQLPVLAPYALLRAADPLPHDWAVTSDSIAAWLAGALEAPRLVLVKPPGAPGDASAVDAHFARALPAATAHAIVPADALARLASALGGD